MVEQKEQLDEMRGLIHGALSRRRQAIVYEVARKILRVMQSHSLPGRVEEGATGTAWVRIESLSQLRSEVGGRFQNLKEKWIAAGFPLREHRGDRAGDAELDYDGWVELAAWINKQGYEVRLASDTDKWLFEVRQISE